MIDGTKMCHTLTEFEVWKDKVNFQFGTTVLDSGEILSRVRNVNGLDQTTVTHKATFETYNLKLKEVERKQFRGNSLKDYYLSIDGSLHKNFFGGENYSRFNWDDLQSEINKIETELKLNSHRTDIVNIEFGVNVHLPFNVFDFLKRCLISHKGRLFNSYRPDKKGFILGYYCDHSQYSVKIYDKGKQFDLPEPLMRFELRFTKMQPLKEYGIKNLSDLKNKDNVRMLFKLLQTAWDNVLLYDYSINLNSQELKTKERELLLQGSNPKYWERLKESNTRAFNSKREQFRKLIKTHGKGLHEDIASRIKTEWDLMFEDCTNLPSGKNNDLYNFTVKVNGKNGHFENQRLCESCGKPLHPDQRKGSKFCSSKYVGYVAAHRCRNQDSNPRNRQRAKNRHYELMPTMFDLATLKTEQ